MFWPHVHAEAVPAPPRRVWGRKRDGGRLDEAEDEDEAAEVKEEEHTSWHRPERNQGRPHRRVCGVLSLLCVCVCVVMMMSMWFCDDNDDDVDAIRRSVANVWGFRLFKKVL